MPLVQKLRCVVAEPVVDTTCGQSARDPANLPLRDGRVAVIPSFEVLKRVIF